MTPRLIIVDPDAPDAECLCCSGLRCERDRYLVTLTVEIGADDTDAAAAVARAAGRRLNGVCRGNSAVILHAAMSRPVALQTPPKENDR